MKNWKKVALGCSVVLLLVGADVALNGGFFTACALGVATAGSTVYGIGRSIDWGIKKIKNAFSSKKPTQFNSTSQKNLLVRPLLLKNKNLNKQKEEIPALPLIKVDFDEKSRNEDQPSFSNNNLPSSSKPLLKHSGISSKESFIPPSRPRPNIPYLLYGITEEVVILKNPYVRNENLTEYHLPVKEINNLNKLKKSLGKTKIISFIKSNKNDKYDVADTSKEEIKPDRLRKESRTKH